MFAPKIAKPQTKTTADSSSFMYPRSTLTAQRHAPERAIGNQATLRRLSAPARNLSGSVPGIIQPKLVVGEANDPLEHEADRIADQVIRMPLSVRTDRGAALQRKCAACEEAERS